ncbi:MAG: hypothetical protein JWO82_3935, partial [Akkermansiaceae bacterium]|nr:hypothetical protein [Akkermansiaceae bacterium]
MSREEEPLKKPRPRRRGKKRLIALGTLIALAVWLNGPGWRWIGGMVLRSTLEKADMKADFTLSGTLIDGISVDRLSLSGGVIKKLEIGSAGPLYRVRQVIRGELKGVAVDRVDVVIDLNGATKKPEEPKKPFDPQELATTLRKVRALLKPMYLNVADIRFQLVRGEESLVVLDTSGLVHDPGSDDYRLKLGAIAAGAGYAFPTQQTVLHWADESLSVDQFNLTPRLG